MSHCTFHPKHFITSYSQRKQVQPFTVNLLLRNSILLSQVKRINLKKGQQEIGNSKTKTNHKTGMSVLYHYFRLLSDLTNTIHVYRIVFKLVYQSPNNIMRNVMKKASIQPMGKNGIFADLNTTKLNVHSGNPVYPISLV